MSYCRLPYYIYPNINGKVCFDVFGDIPDDVVNIFLYKIYTYHKEEFDKRVKDGKMELEKWEESKNKPQSFEDMYEEPTERYCTVTESLEQSLKEMQLMREGKILKKTWREHMKEWEKWAKEVEDELKQETLERVELEENTECNTFEEQWFNKSDIILNENKENTYKVADKETAKKAMEDCTKKYNKALKNLVDS